MGREITHRDIKTIECNNLEWKVEANRFWAGKIS